MKKSTSAYILYLTLISALTLSDAVSGDPEEVGRWLEKVNHEKHPEKMTKLHFYFHDLIQGNNVTSATVAQSNISSPAPAPFGLLISADDPLTVGPGRRSKRVGYLRGLYATTSFEEVDLIMAMTFVFTEGISNGSSISILGHNPHEQYTYREVPVVGGSGRFRLARGVATLKTYYYNPNAGRTTIEVNVIVFHY